MFHNSYISPARRRHTVTASSKPRAPRHSQWRGTRIDLPEGFKYGVLICYDCNLIENVRITALRARDSDCAPPDRPRAAGIRISWA